MGYVTSTIPAIDNAVKSSLLWDNDNLYIALDITDDNISNSGTWTEYNDGFEIDIDPNLDRGFSFTDQDLGLLWSAKTKTTGYRSNLATIETIASSFTSKGYTVEITIPWNKLGIIPAAGKKFGLEISNFDADNSGYKGMVIYSGHSWNNGTALNGLAEVTLSDEIRNGGEPPDDAATITGSATVCQNQNNVTYSILPVNGATSYNWTLPAGATGTSTTTTISVNFPTTSATGTLSVKGHNSYGEGVPSSLAVTVKPLPQTPVITQVFDSLVSSSTTGNQWYQNTTPLQNATRLSYKPRQNGPYSVIITLDGCPSILSNIINVNNVGLAEMNSLQQSVCPNPNNGRFSLICHVLPDQYIRQIDLYDLNGKKLRTLEKGQHLTEINREFDVHDLPDGIYSLVLISQKGSVILKLMITH
jgi:hypothetical protein